MRGTRHWNGGPRGCSLLSGAWRSCLGSLPGVCCRLRHKTSRLLRWYGARSLEILSRLVILKHSKENLEPEVIYQIWAVVCFSSEFCIVRLLTILLCFYCLDASWESR